jgi:hypothetical protein
VREEAQAAALISCTRRTLCHHGNTGFRYTGIEDLASIRFPKIQANLPGINRADKKFLGVPELPSEL